MSGYSLLVASPRCVKHLNMSTASQQHHAVLDIEWILSSVTWRPKIWFGPISACNANIAIVWMSESSDSPAPYSIGWQWGPGPLPAVWAVRQSQGVHAGLTALTTGLQDDPATEDTTCVRHVCFKSMCKRECCVHTANFTLGFVTMTWCESYFPPVCENTSNAILTQ